MASSDDRDRKEQKVKPLFPLASAEQVDTTRPSLFPLVSAGSSDVTSLNYGENDLNWLENKSFIPTSLLLAEEERKTATQDFAVDHDTSATRQAGSSPQQSSSEEEEEEDRSQSPTEIKPVKRSLSESESDNEEIPAFKSRRKDKERRSSSRAKKKQKKKKKHKHRGDRNERIPEENRKVDSSSDLKNQPDKTFLHEVPGLQPEFAFRIDKKSEKSLWNYESVYKGHIARFHRLTNICLGNVNISMSEKKEKSKESSNRYYSKEKRKEARKQGVKVMVDKSVENKTTEYINIQDKSGDVHSLHSEKLDQLGILDSATASYCQGKGIITAEDKEDNLGKDETLERTAYYNSQLQKNPNNVKLWMEFIFFQDQLFQDAHSSAMSASNKRIRDVFQPPRACIEKKLAIINKALEANPSSLDLKLLKLEIEQDVCDSSALAKEWDNLLFVHAGDVRLWRHYLMFQQSRLASFSVGRMIKLYHRCFKTLGPVLEGKVNVIKKSETLEEDLLGVFEQYCLFLHGSGHTEKAVASFQALIEFNLFRPPSLNLTPTPDCVLVFESFWDSGVARFGEASAKGWAAWVDSSKSDHHSSVGHVSTDEEQEQILQQNLPVWQTWQKIERLRQQCHFLPWRPDLGKDETEDDCEDLDRLVLYDDVAPVLLRLQQSASFSTLVQCFVNLLGLVQCQTPQDNALHFDQLKLSALYQIHGSSEVSVNIPVDSTWQPRAEVTAFLEQVLRQSAAYFTNWRKSLFNCQILRLHTQKHGCHDITLLPDKAVKEVRKFGKSLLKEVQNRNDLLLWDAYIRNEWAFGKTKDALSMLQTALTMFTSSASCNDHANMVGLCSLYRTLAEILLDFTPLELVHLKGRKLAPSSECKNKVLNSFVCLIDTAEFKKVKAECVPAAQVLRTRRKFHSMMTTLFEDFSSLSTDLSARQHVLLFVNCFALFELCAAGLHECVQVFETAFQNCTVTSQKESNSQFKPVYTDLEKKLFQSLLCMLRNYMSLHAVPISKLRCHLDTALSRFPESPWFLGRFVEMELKTFMAGRLRRYFETSCQNPGSVYPVLFSVLAELSRHAKILTSSSARTQGQGEGMTDSGIVHRVRAVCERGLRQKVAQHCPLLWRLYLTFEARYGSMERARGVLYRALQSCPWAKVLYMDGAELFGDKQTEELVDLMTEKELRVQIPMEEVELLMGSEPQDAEDDKGDVNSASEDLLTGSIKRQLKPNVAVYEKSFGNQCGQTL